MRELFEEEIKQSMAMLQADRIDEQPTMPRPALSREALLGSGLRAVVEPESSMEETPSELRGNAGQAMPTAAAQASLTAGSSTDIHYVDTEEPPRTSRLAVALAVITGMIAVLGLSAAGWFFWLADDHEANKKPRPDLTPAVIVETPTPSEPAKQAGPTEEPISPVNEPGLANEATPPEPDPDPADGASAGTPAADGDPEAKADAPVPAEPSSPPKDDNTKASADTRSPRS